MTYFTFFRCVCPDSGFLLGSNQKKKTFKGTDWSIPIELSYSLSRYLHLSINYNIGLADISRNGFKNTDIKNNWIGVSLLLFK